MRLALLILLLFISASVQADEAISVSPCDLAADPPGFDGKVVAVRAPLKIGFEESHFDGTCEQEGPTSIWVTFAGDADTPVVYCCGNHERKKGSSVEVAGKRLSLQKDEDFRKYWSLLTAVRKTAPPGVPCFWDCYQYRVTATLTGHFFAGERWKREDGQVFYMGYGHLGCCSLFVIEKVSDVQAEPTGIPIGDQFNCSHQSWELPVQRDATLAKQKAVHSKLLEAPDPEYEAETLVRQKMKDAGDDFSAGDANSVYAGPFQKERRLSYFWLSRDKLKSYSVTLERFDWLAAIANKIDERIWTPVRMERAECKPRN